MKKVISALGAAALTVLLFTGCAGKAPDPAQGFAASTAEVSTETSAETTLAKTPETNERYTLKIGSLKGPTSMGLVSLMDKAETGNAKGSYEFTMVTAADELLGKIANKELDIALIPANTASVLYGKTNQAIQVLNINTLGVLYMASSDDSIRTAADLKGKTIYLTGKGTTPDYALRYILNGNGLTENDLTLEYKSEAAEVAAILKENPSAVGLLPQPFAMVALAQNDALDIVLNLEIEWSRIAEETGSTLVTGVTICRKEVLEQYKEAVDLFLEEHKESADFSNTQPAQAAALIAAAGIIEKASVAEKAIPYCGIVSLGGEEMKSRLSGYLEVLFNLDPAFVGGSLPDDSFYYLP